MLDTEKWWQTQLAKDVHSSLRRREIELPVYHSKSPQICYRRFLVNWLALLGEKLDLFQEVVHLAVRYLDHVMDRYELLMESQLNMLAVCCLSLAGRISWYQLFRNVVTLLSREIIFPGPLNSRNWRPFKYFRLCGLSHNQSWKMAKSQTLIQNDKNSENGLDGKGIHSSESERCTEKIELQLKPAEYLFWQPVYREITFFHCQVVEGEFKRIFRKDYLSCHQSILGTLVSSQELKSSHFYEYGKGTIKPPFSIKPPLW